MKTTKPAKLPKGRVMFTNELRDVCLEYPDAQLVHPVFVLPATPEAYEAMVEQVMLRIAPLDCSGSIYKERAKKALTSIGITNPEPKKKK